MIKNPKVGDKVYLGNGIVSILGPDIDLDKEIFLDRNGKRITEKIAKELASKVSQIQ